ncbi:unnamed protein product [Phytomonas sp. Hart1]|nr:unnamed protein product [Phytomonas sp. Hart1]|eukprot:CCW71713.1 unnamed protein product [Phytomonas sp. isolate Hart1]
MHFNQAQRQAHRLGSTLRIIFYVIITPIIFGFLLLTFACMYYYIHLTIINPAGNLNSNFEGDYTTKTFSLFDGSEAVVHYHNVDPHTEYTLLEPGDLIVGEALRNPALESLEDCFLEESELAQRLFPRVRRYFLQNTVKDRRYELHISYPGSPPVGFHILLYHVRSSSISLRNMVNEKSKKETFSRYPISSSSSHRLLDTEVRIITMDRERSNRYSPHQTIHYNIDDLKNMKDNNNIAGILNKVSPGRLEEDPFVAVVEIQPYVLALSSQSPCLFPEIMYNIQLECLTGNLLPITIIPIVVGITVIMIITSVILWFVYQKKFLISPEIEEFVHEVKVD